MLASPEHSLAGARAPPPVSRGTQHTASQAAPASRGTQPAPVSRGAHNTVAHIICLQLPAATCNQPTNQLPSQPASQPTNPPTHAPPCLLHVRILADADPGMCGLDPGLFGLDPGMCRLDPGMCGLDPGMCGLNPGLLLLTCTSWPTTSAGPLPPSPCVSPPWEGPGGGWTPSSSSSAYTPGGRARPRSTLYFMLLVICRQAVADSSKWAYTPGGRARPHSTLYFMLLVICRQAVAGSSRWAYTHEGRARPRSTLYFMLLQVGSSRQ